MERGMSCRRTRRVGWTHLPMSFERFRGLAHPCSSRDDYLLKRCSVLLISSSGSPGPLPNRCPQLRQERRSDRSRVASLYRSSLLAAGMELPKLGRLKARSHAVFGIHTSL